MEFSYYPGCSLEATAKEFNMSAVSVSGALGIELKEIEDWVCCGATSAHSTNKKLAITLPALNLAQAQNTGLDMAIPCASCYNRMKKTDYVMRSNEEKRKEIEEIIGFKYTGEVKVMSLLEAIVNEPGINTVAARVVKPLTGLRLACYYGCLLVRPPAITRFDRPENPVIMDDLMKALGAEPVQWSYKTDC